MTRFYMQSVTEFNSLTVLFGFQVLRVHMRNSTFAEGTSVLYEDDGSQLSASTVGSLYNNAMLVGSVTDTLVYCTGMDQP